MGVSAQPGGAAIGAPPSLLQPRAALVAVLSAQVILHPATGAVGRQLPAGHCYERAIRAVDDLQVPDHKAIVKSDRAKCFQALSRLFHEFDANLGDFHGRSPCDCARPTDNSAWRTQAPVAAFEEY